MMDDQDSSQGALRQGDRAVVNGAASVSAVPASVPSAVHTAELQFGGLTMKVYHLDDGRRVIDEQSIVAFFAALENGTLLLSKEDADTFASAVRL